MIRNNIKSKKGFTIIEVVLVLAIAGLIFLMVFIAFPALQRGQRDTQRRDDMARFASQLAQYQANNYGNVPTGEAVWNKFIKDYLRSDGDTFADPSGHNYHVIDTTDSTDETNKDGTGTAITTCSLSDCPEDGSNPATNKSTAEDTALGVIRIYTNATCSGETPVYKKGTKYIAFTYKLEGAGIYCGHN